MPSMSPLVFHPTTTVLLDDNRSSLAILRHQLDKKLNKVVFNDATIALTWLLNDEQIRRRNQRNSKIVGELCASTTLWESLDNVFDYVKDASRFELPTVIVVDYMMPEMNGVEFCQSIAQLSFKKIMFSANADEGVAIDAFNDCMIDRFIRKQDANALDKLENELIKLQVSYFVQQSGRFGHANGAMLEDPAIANLIRDCCNRHGFVETYILPNQSAVLFFDETGFATLMPIHTEYTMARQFNVATDRGAPAELLTALFDNKMVPFFYTPDSMYDSSEVQDWRFHCVPVETLRGAATYYWGLFQLPMDYRRRPVASYKKFLAAAVAAAPDNGK